MKKLVAFTLFAALLISIFTCFVSAEALAYPESCGISGISTQRSASARISGEHSGLRFKTHIAHTLIDELIAEYGKENISVGTLIAPTDTLKGKALTHGIGSVNVDYIDVLATIDKPFASFDAYNVYAGSIVDINKSNLGRSFTAVGYIKIHKGAAQSFIYSESSAARTVSFVASSAFDDVSDIHVENRYDHLITDQNDIHNGKYSPYTAYERERIASLISYEITKKEISLQYDDYVTELGNIKATSETVTINESDCLEIVTKNGVKYFHAKSVGAVTVTDGNESEAVNIGKARLHLVVVMGQSNAGCHFANALSDVKCSIGTAYWWGSSGASSKAPVDFTNGTTGFHAPLIAELRAQSVAAGSPEKPVMIWYEGATSKNGKPITAWAASPTDTSGTNATVDMIKNCIAYYTAGERAELYEIVESGAVWLQGEGGADAVSYKQCFMAMWSRLKDAGLEYMAFFRVRKGVSFNKTVTDHNDLGHHGALRAQMDMINENSDMYLVSTLTENWIGQVTDKHSVDISKYITMMEFYGKSENYSDTLGNKATFKNGILTATMKELYGENNWCHYGKFGYGIIGADAAYNLYRALHEDDFAIVYADTSGMVEGQITLKDGESAALNVKNMTNMLTFRPACYSTAGTLDVKVTSGGIDITNVSGVLSTNSITYMAVAPSKLLSYDDVAITATYTTENGKSGSVVFNIVTE